MNTRNLLASTVIYFGILWCAFSYSTVHPRAQGGPAPSPTAAPQGPAAKPHFSLSTNHTFGTSDKPRVWISYQDIDHLDFRVYRVRDPLAFFKQLNDPHQMGEQEKTQVSQN